MTMTDPISTDPIFTDPIFTDREPPIPGFERERYRGVLDAVLAFSQGQDFAGYNKHDGLNSPFLRALLGFARWPRILAIQLVMRSPWNVRPWLGVPRTRNPKGLGLFASAHLDLWAASGQEEHLAMARELLDWLLEHPATGFRGLSWGYPYPWQDVGFFAPRHYPNRVVTCWIGFAFLEAARQTGEDRYLEALPRIAEFLLGEPNVLYDDSEMLCLSYVPDPAVTVAVIDVPALVGAYLAEAGQILDRRDLVADAQRLLRWVVDKQTEYGAWFYTHPRGDSFITHDNYHTAIILDCLDRYREATGDESFDGAYKAGLAFYRDHHFTAAGAPRWMHDGTGPTDHPHDIHGSGSAVLCFVRAARRDPAFWDEARRVLDWTLEHMYDRRGYFYYQVTRFMTKRFCLLRWCNGWMSWALASLLRYSRPADNLESSRPESSRPESS